MAYGTVNADVIQTSTSGGILGAGNASIMKNRLINGDMRIFQRATSVTASNYFVDRWQYLASQSSKGTANQSSTAPTGFSFSSVFTSSSAYSVGASDYFVIDQSIEGFNTADLAWGTANAKTVTLSFWVQSSLTGTFGGAFRNAAGNRNYPFSYTISAANTWEYKTVTVAGDTTGTWVGATNGVGLDVSFGLGAGSSFSGTAGAWGTGNLVTCTGATSVVGTSGATFYITGVQLEVGSSATGFEYRQYGQELALCQRYFASLQEGIWTANGSGTATAGIYMPVTMRTAPTLSTTPSVITIWDPQQGSYTQSSTSGSLPLGGTSANFVIIQCGNFSGMNTGRTLFYQSGGSIQLGAEL